MDDYRLQMTGTEIGAALTKCSTCPQTSFPSIDTSRVLTSQTAYMGTWTYTATENCFISYYQNANGRYDGYPKINEVSIFSSSDQGMADIIFPVSAGQVVKIMGLSNTGGAYIKVFGVKY